MSPLLPNQTRILSEVCSDPAALAEAQLGHQRVVIDKFIAACVSFVQTNHKHLAQHYVLEFFPATTSGKVLVFQDVLKACATDKPILRIDADLKLHANVAGSARVSDACSYTADAQRLQVVVHGTYAYVVLCGQIVQESDILNPSKMPPIGIMYFRHAVDIPSAIGDHFDVHVRREKGFKYWHDASKRLLVASPESTERIFQRSIYLWLEANIIDKLRVYAEPRGFGQDATDVTVVTISGEHIIEVKWLGKNASGTEYKQERINEGLRQVALYLDNDVRAIRGYVLLYDGRPRDKHDQESNFDPAVRHERCDTPIVLFLENETPSQAAKVKSAKP